MTLEQQLLRSIELLQAQAIARRALLEPRPRFRKYKARFALLALEKAHEHLSEVVETSD